MRQALQELPLPPLSVKLIEAVRPAEPLPVVAPSQPPINRPSPSNAKPQTASKATPVIAMTPDQQSPSANVPTVAPPAPVAETPVAVARPSVATAATTVTPARFDAAYLQNPKPAYPSLSRRLGEEGKVLLKVRVTTEGHPAAVDLEKSSNFERLDEAARQAVTRWRFVPARRGDEAVEASVIVPVVFRLDT